jgi:sugar phosphate isomerase/epimerase
MHYGIAIWNYCPNPAGMEVWVDRAVAAGFDTISLLPNSFEGEREAHLPNVVRLLRERGLWATIHGRVAMDLDFASRMIEAAGDRLYAFTCDSLITEDSRGRLHDASRIAVMLAHVQRATAGTGVRLAIEDFPLDAAAKDFFRDELGAVYNDSRTGILVDVGHMHIRRSQSPYFGARTIAEYFQRIPVPIMELHLHDNDGSKDQHGHFGFGTVPFKEVAEAVTGIGFDGMSTIEVAPGFHGSTPEASWDKAVASLERWRELLGL